MTRKEKETAQRKEHILQVAETLFAEKGLQNTSVADIAQAAEFGVGTIYKYFADKSTLIDSLMVVRTESHFDNMEAALDDTLSPPEAVERLIEAFLMSINRHRRFFKIFFTYYLPALESNALSPGLKTLEKRKLELFSRVNDIFRKGMDSGQFVNVGDEAYLTATTWGVLMSFYFLLQRKSRGVIDVQQMKQTIQQLLFDKVRLTV
ncbi:MAG: TetR/AcrR family transcriptional regulator [Deltaproteobacteria bacterium]|nr:TetR/AcrR family transcriptional regulator [Deltaproteobacteria bacterium]